MTIEVETRPGSCGASARSGDWPGRGHRVAPEQGGCAFTVLLPLRSTPAS